MNQNETPRLHQIVAVGTLEELRVALGGGQNVINAAGHCGITAPMLAAQCNDVEKVALLVESGADPELADDFNHTALRYAVHADSLNCVRFLLSLGVDRGYSPRYPLKERDWESLSSHLPAELRESIRALGELPSEPSIEPMISEVQSVEVLKLFLEAGDDLKLASNEMKRAYVGLKQQVKLQITSADYERDKTPRDGVQNPELMHVPFWRDMIRVGCNAYVARTQFGDSDPFSVPGAVWCYDRFGSSLTPLSDGRFVQIGGEHEDYYDPDFFIYNDVVVHDGRGEFEIYGYPREVFPPTDFHTATLCRDAIYIIGCLGYSDQRQSGFTPVYRMSLETWHIERITATGESPGWIYRHHAEYDPGRHTIGISGGVIHSDQDPSREIPNEEHFELDLARLEWSQRK